MLIKIAVRKDKAMLYRRALELVNRGGVPMIEMLVLGSVKGYLLLVVHPDKKIIAADLFYRSPVAVIDPHEPVILQE